MPSYIVIARTFDFSAKFTQILIDTPLCGYTSSVSLRSTASPQGEAKSCSSTVRSCIKFRFGSRSDGFNQSAPCEGRGTIRKDGGGVVGYNFGKLYCNTADGWFALITRYYPSTAKAVPLPSQGEAWFLFSAIKRFCTKFRFGSRADMREGRPLPYEMVS